MSWHTKYRPRKVSDLLITEVRELLLKLMKSGQFPQVFLCAGPKGTGKTSTARIIGAMLNDPVNAAAIKSGGKLVDPTVSNGVVDSIFSGDSYLVQEQDAASNRGIDDVRALKERANLPPQGAPIAVYILDEVHMLTPDAFNALLKLLEEPPKHAVFVLATTELHKVPATVQSRCTILPFRKATQTELVAALHRVALAENLSLTPTATEQIASYADGSFRDGIKALELVAAVAAGEPISDEMVATVLNVGFLQQIPPLLQSVVAKSEQSIVTLLAEWREKGVNSQVAVRSIIAFLHQDLLQSVGVAEGTPLFSQRVSHFLLQELQLLPVVSVEPLPLLALELKLLDLVFRSKDRTAADRTAPPEAIPPAKPKVVVPQTPAASKPSSQPEAKSEPVVKIESHQIVLAPLVERWTEFVSAVEKTNSTLAAFLRSASPQTTQTLGTLVVTVFYPFHRDQLMQPRFMEILQNTAEPFLGGKPGFEFVVAAPQEAIAETALM